MLRWLVRIAGLIVILIVVAVGSLFLLPADKVAQIAANQLRTVTGREVTISGDVSMTLFPVLGASVGGLEIGGAAWSDKGPMITARNAAIGVDAMALLRGDIRITNIAAQSPTIRLESRKDGRASWVFTDASGQAQIATETAPSRREQTVSIDRLQVTDATLIYDAEGADLVTYQGVDLTLDWPERDGPARIDAVLRPTGAPVTARAEIDGFADFLAGDSKAVDTELETSSGRMSFAGTADLTGEVAGDLDLNLSDTAGFLRALGLPAVDLPRGLGRSLTLTTPLRLSNDRLLTLSALQADLGGNRASGDFQVSLNGVPDIRANLDFGALDLKPAMGGGGTANESGGGGGGGSSAGGWSTDRLDMGWLGGFNGQIGFAASGIDLGALRFGPTRGALTNDQSRMVISLPQAAAYEGNLAGELVLNNRSGFSVGGSLAGRGLQLQGLLGDLAGIDRLTGGADAQISFLGSGGSVDAIMNSLSGNGAISTGRGTIRGIDLDSLLRSGSPGGGTTIFDSLSASFTIAGGNLQNNDLKMILPVVQAEGAGRIGLGARDIDYRFTPTAFRSDTSSGLAIPVRIRGPWADPKIQPDLEKAIELNSKKEIEEIKQKAEEKLKEKLSVGEGQEGVSLKEQARDKIEKDLGNKLLKKIFD